MNIQDEQKEKFDRELKNKLNLCKEKYEKRKQTNKGLNIIIILINFWIKYN